LRTVSDAKEIEALILELNNCHLQQASIEISRTDDPLIERMLTKAQTYSKTF
jgi:hypothetical protein